MFTTFILFFLQDFFFRETNFYFYQFLSNFLRYFSSNSLLFHPCNIFTIYFPSSSFLLKSLFSSISNFSFFLTSTFNLLSNSATTFFAFSKFFSLFQLLCSTINLFHHTKYFNISLIFLLFSIFSYSSTFSTFTSFISSTFCPLTCSLYHTTWLIFTTGWILIEVGNCSLTTLVDTTLSMIYGPIYQSTNFLASCSLNTRSFILSITFSPTFHAFAFFLLLSAYCFISFYALLKAAPASSCIFFILSANSITFSIFPFLLISIPILNSLS